MDEQKIKELIAEAQRESEAKTQAALVQQAQVWAGREAKQRALYESKLGQFLDKDELQDIRVQAKEDDELEELRAQLQGYQQREAQAEAKQQKQDYIDSICERFGISPGAPGLDESNPDAFLDSAMIVFKQQYHPDLQAGGSGPEGIPSEGLETPSADDWIGTMTPEESRIAEKVLRKAGSMAPDELKQRVQAVIARRKGE